MISRGWWIDPYHSILLLWNECGEDPFIFCYRISQGAFVVVRERANASAQLAFSPLRTKRDCSTSSANFSIASTTLKE